MAGRRVERRSGVMHGAVVWRRDVMCIPRAFASSRQTAHHCSCWRLDTSPRPSAGLQGRLTIFCRRPPQGVCRYSTPVLLYDSVVVSVENILPAVHSVPVRESPGVMPMNRQLACVRSQTTLEARLAQVGTEIRPGASLLHKSLLGVSSSWVVYLRCGPLCILIQNS